MTTTLSPPAEQTGVPPAPARRESKWRRRGPLLPALIFTIIVTQLPFLLTIAISLLNWNVLEGGDKNFLGFGQYESFAWFDNFVSVFTDARLRTAVLNTIVLTASVVLISLLLGLLLAVLLDRKFPGRGVARTLLIAPFLVMPVASALLWKHALYNPDSGCSTVSSTGSGSSSGPTRGQPSTTSRRHRCRQSWRRWCGSGRPS
jgi:sorbitol/mannitol transport system permease protein